MNSHLWYWPALPSTSDYATNHLNNSTVFSCQFLYPTSRSSIDNQQPVLDPDSLLLQRTMAAIEPRILNRTTAFTTATSFPTPLLLFQYLPLQNLTIYSLRFTAINTPFTISEPTGLEPLLLNVSEVSIARLLHPTTTIFYLHSTSSPAEPNPHCKTPATPILYAHNSLAHHNTHLTPL